MKETLMKNDPDLKTNYVFLDTQVYVEHRLDWSARAMGKLVEFAKANVLKLLITNITKREVRSYFRKMAAEAQSSLEKHRLVLKQLNLETSINDLDASTKTLFSQFEKSLKEARVKEISTPTDAQSILNDYFDRRPPFGEGKKKAEFPDAFVVAGLKNWCSSTGNSIYVVSRDSDLLDCCDPGGPLIHLPTIADLLSLAFVRSELRLKLVKALRSSKHLERRIEEQITTGRIESADSDIELEDITVDTVSVLNANVIDRHDDTYLLEVEVEVEISGQVRRQWIGHAERFGELEPEQKMRVEYFGSVQYLYPEVEVRFDANDPDSLDIESVHLGPDKLEVELSQRRHLLGSRSGTMRLRIGHY